MHAGFFAIICKIMSKEKKKLVFNIAVIGLSGTEQVKGACGVGKSCLCNRFVREDADDYYPDHTSVLSQSDFGGRIVNNDHFLYWGEITKQDDNGQEYKFNVIEQTEFIDDQSYQAHRSSSNQSYLKRSAQTKVNSAEKLMYICTDQLGIEQDFVEKPMPDGKLTIDGYVLCFDVSSVTNRSITDQVHFVQLCYHSLAKTKKPVVLALTKCDEAVPSFIKEAQAFAANAGGKKSNFIPIIETSASENINVTLTFLILAQQIDKTRSKSKVSSFDDAAQARKELLKEAKEKLESLLIEIVDDYHAVWLVARKNLEGKPEYLEYVKLEGKNAASKIFRKHVTLLRDEFRLNLQNDYMRFFSKALKKILPDLSQVRSTWHDTLKEMASSPAFPNWIVKLEDISDGVNGKPWYENPHVKSLEDRRIPYELLLTAEAERYFLFHKQDLEAQQKRSEMREHFRELLSQNTEVTPGREWTDVAKFFKSDSMTDLPEAELSTMYEQYQSDITEKAKKDFQELLHEKSEIFVINNLDINDINDALQSDLRFIAMEHLRHEKNEILTRHISQTLSPPSDTWGAQAVAFALKSRRTRLSSELPNDQTESPFRWRLTPDSESVNVVLLGADELSRELANEITVHSSEEFTVNGCVYRLRLRSVTGDLSLPANSFKTSSFFPHGCIAVYSSMDSLNYIESGLEVTVGTSGATDEENMSPTFQGLPVSVLLASPSSSKKEVHLLRDAGERLANRIGCPFIDVVPPDFAHNRRFHETQIRMVMTSLIDGIKKKAGTQSASNSHSDNGQQTEPPDLRILMCSRKDDFAAAETALAPLLNHASFHDPGAFEKQEEEEEETEDTIKVETYLGTQRRRIAVTITSYQNAKNHLSKGSPIHGFILVYDTLLKSSFSIMKVFAKHTVSSYPLLILCVSTDDKKPAASFFQQDPASRQLVMDGNNLADELRAKFVSASARHRRQGEVYVTFFKDAWEHKEETESIHNINRAVVEDDASQEDSVEEQPPEPPVPAPRTNLYRQKANSAEQIASKPILDYGINDTSVTPPSTLKLNFSSGSYQRDVSSHATPGSAWSIGSDETPNTSPTAGLIDNEVTPDYSDYPLDANRSTPPVQSSHLYPGIAANPGKLNPDLINKISAGIRKQSPNFVEALSYRVAPDPPCLAVSDHSKAGAIKVLPSPGEQPPKSGAKSEVKSDSKLPRHTVTNGYDNDHQRRGLRFVKRAPLKSVDMDTTPTSARTPPTARQTRHSTADLLSHSFSTKLEIDGGGISKKTFGGSHEDLLRLSPSVPYGLSGTGLGDGNERIPPKDRLPYKKNKEEKKKEEKKSKEKEQRIRYKENKKHAARNFPAAPVTIGNKHNISDYFNKGLDDIIQSLNHLVPLFAEKCVSYIEYCGLQTEGLYRVPANQREREMIITKFDEDNNYDLKLSEASVHTVAGCLTWFFSHKNLPEPLISTHLHDELEEAVAMPSNVRNLAIRGVIRKLPYSNFATFKFISTHLKNVSDHSDVNKMTVDNLAICWCNTLFRPLMETTIALPKSFYKDVLTTCVNQCGFMFYDQPEQ